MVRQQAELQMPIFFEGADPASAASLEASAASQCHGVRNASYPAQLGTLLLVLFLFICGSRGSMLLLKNLFTPL